MNGEEKVHILTTLADGTREIISLVSDDIRQDALTFADRYGKYVVYGAVLFVGYHFVRRYRDKGAA